MSRPVKQTAYLLRRASSPPTRQEVSLMKHATALRKARGLYRDLFSTEEMDLLSTARRLAYDYGQVQLARFLTLRRRGQKRRAVRLGDRFHECPKCGARHTEPMKTLKPTKAKLAEEKRLVEAALKRARRK